MNLPTHDELAAALLPAAARAARLELEYLRNKPTVERKADASPVTIADQEAEAIIVEALGQVAGDVPVIAEELYSAGHSPEIDGTYFLVDALDGTREFVKGGTDFTINVALIKDHIPTFGLILLPVNGELYLTTAPDIAVCTVLDLSHDTDLAELDLKPLRTREPDPAALVVALSSSHPSAKLERELDGKPVSGRVEAGSSLKFCRVAEGRADFYPRLGSISEWDIAAGHAIVRAAGGEVTGLDGVPLRYGNRDGGFRTLPFVAWGREHLKNVLHFTRE